MRRSETSLIRGPLVLLAAAMAVMLGGCTGYEESGLPGSDASIARNQIMWVSAEARTFGYGRLMSRARIYPDLELFVRKRGMPDFMAETADRRRVYFILYYLEDREAFACRTRPGAERLVEFSGPYPVTDKEYETLDGFRTKAQR